MDRIRNFPVIDHLDHGKSTLADRFIELTRAIAASGKRIVARETVEPFRRDVLAKLYGGDDTRKMKVLEKQKEGKKRMWWVGKVDIPQDALLNILEIKERKRNI